MAIAVPKRFGKSETTFLREFEKVQSENIDESPKTVTVGNFGREKIRTASEEMRLQSPLI